MKDCSYDAYYSSHYIDFMPKNRAEWRWTTNLIETHLGRYFQSLGPKSVVLDVGCGVGYLEYYLLDRGCPCHIFAIDVSAQQIEVAKGILAKTFPNFDRQVSFIEANGVEYLSAGDRSYDCIAFVDVLEHFTREEVLRSLTASHRAVDETGFVIVRVPNMDNPFNATAFHRDFTHLTPFTAQSLTQCLKSSGFAHVDTLYERWPPHPRDLRDFKSHLKFFVRTLRQEAVRILFSVPREAMCFNLIAVASKTRASAK